jgi:hypothetical protein
LSSASRRAAVYLAVTIAWSWPLPIHLTNRFAHDPGDPLLNTFLIWWNAHALPWTVAYWNAPYYWPMHGALALTEHFAGLSPITTPMQWLGASPLTAENLLIICATWWSGLAADALLRRLGASTLGCFCGGLAFAFAPYRTSQLGHIQLYACWWLPLMLLALHAWFDQKQIRYLAVLGVAWALQGLTNGYFLLFTPVLIGCWLAWFTRRREIAAAGGAIAALAIAAIPVFPFLLTYRNVQKALGLTRTSGEMAMFSANLNAFASAHPMMRFWHTAEPSTTEHYLFPGVTVPLIVLCGVFAARRDRRFWFYVAAAALMTLFCLGPASGAGNALWHPYSLLMWLPGYSGLRVPSRFFMLAALCLAVAAGLAFDAIEKRLPAAGVPVFAVIVFGGLAYDGAIAGMPLGVPPPRLNVTEPGARLLALPFEDGRVSVAAMYQSMFDRMPVVNGYAGYVPPHADVIEWALHRGDETVLTELRRGHPLYVLVASTENEATWTGFMDARPDAQLLGVKGGGRLYRMPAVPFASAPRAGTPVDGVTVTTDPGWLIADLKQPQRVRGVEVRTGGVLHLIPDELIVQVSDDGATWRTVFDTRPGGIALMGALASPLTIPLRIDLADVEARYLRVDTPAFTECVVYRP